MTASLRVEVAAHQLDGAQQLLQALQRVVLALDRDQHLGRRHERVDGQQAERRRAVDEDVVQVVRVELADRPGQPGLARHQRHQLDLRARQVDGRGRAVQVLESRDPARSPRPGAGPRRARCTPRRCRSGDRRPAPWTRCPAGSRSTTSTREPCIARLAARLTAVVVLPTPPFWLAIVMIRHERGRGHCWPPARATTAACAALAIGVSADRPGMATSSSLSPGSSSELPSVGRGPALIGAVTLDTGPSGYGYPGTPPCAGAC